MHQQTHTGEKPYKCSDCGKSFRRASHLKVHHRIHTGEKPYVCSECGKAFNDRSVLSTHQRIHTGEKPYICSDCGKAMSSKANLKEHQRIHTGEKPYVCAECGKAFSDKSSFYRHCKIHSRDKPFVHNKGEKGFLQNSQVTSYEQTQSAEKLQWCSACGKSVMYQLKAYNQVTHITIPEAVGHCTSTLGAPSMQYWEETWIQNTESPSKSCHFNRLRYSYQAFIRSHKRIYCRVRSLSISLIKIFPLVLMKSDLSQL